MQLYEVMVLDSDSLAATMDGRLLAAIRMAIWCCFEVSCCGCVIQIDFMLMHDHVVNVNDWIYA